MTKNAASLAPVFALSLALASGPGTALASGGDSGSPRSDERPAVLVIGDSHVERLGPNLSSLVRRAGGRSLGFVARRGWSTAAYERAGDLPALLADRGTPDVLIVSLGGNDQPASRRAYVRQLSWIVQSARQAGVEEVLWIGPASTHLGHDPRSRATVERIERNTEWQREIVPSLGARWLDTRDFTTEGHQADGLHFTVPGYFAWSRALMERWVASDDPAERSRTLRHLRPARHASQRSTTRPTPHAAPTAS